MRTVILIAASFLLILSSGISSFSQVSHEDKNTIYRVIREEKLANNFYKEMYDLYGLRVFKHITSSEEMHIKHMQDLIRQLGLTDPLEGSYSAAGDLNDIEMEKLYAKMVNAGKVSSVEALKESAKFEDMDISGLRELISASNDSCLKNVLGKLERASQNHLRAFVRNLNTRGIKYEPVYLSMEEYAKIVDKD